MSLVRANERVLKHNKRNFPQAKLDGKINAWMFSFKWAQRLIFFLLHNNSVRIILFNLKKKIKSFYQAEKKNT